jgi:hypothetical protein
MEREGETDRERWREREREKEPLLFRTIQRDRRISIALNETKYPVPKSTLQ